MDMPVLGHIPAAWIECKAGLHAFTRGIPSIYLITDSIIDIQMLRERRERHRLDKLDSGAIWRHYATVVILYVWIGKNSRVLCEPVFKTVGSEGLREASTSGEL